MSTKQTADRLSRTNLSRRLPLLLALGGALLALTLVAGAASALPDLAVSNSDVSLGVRSPTQGNTVSLDVTVHNTGNANATGFTVRFTLDGATTLANVAVGSLAAGASTNVSASWSVGATALGAHTLTATADVALAVSESNEGNNAGQISFSVNNPPTAVATVNVTTHETYMTFAFVGSTSSDSDGTIQNYLWIFDDGSIGTGATTTHQFADGGPGAGKSYTVTLVVTDDDGGTGSDQVAVLVTNRAPLAVAPNVVGLTVTALVFDASASTDLDGRIVNATWAFSDAVTLYGLTVLRSFGDNGLYSATVTVRDDDGATSSAVISITINNQAPTPIISTTPVMPFQANQAAFFDGANSYDVDGGITNYTWFFPGGVTVEGWNATHTFPANGTYNVTLLLIDDDGQFAQLTVAALVGNDTIGTRNPTPPVPRIASSAVTVFTGQPVSLDASNSSDDTGIISYLWDFGDGAVGVGMVVSHSWANDGNFVVMLNVTDTDGNSSFGVITIHVKDRAPIAAILASPTDAQTLVLIAFDASSSSDPDGTLLYYRWDFGDGSVLYGRSVQHTYARAGAYTVQLTVTDNDGVDGSATTQVTITNRAPKAVTPANFSVPTFEERIFDASGSFDQDGLVQTYSWNFGDATTATGRSVKHAFATIGTFTVTLTVRDDFGAIGVAAMTVIVTNNAPSAQITAPSSVYTGDSVIFQGNGVDRDGTIASWLWNFGDTQTASTANTATHAYPVQGLYTVTLTVTDNNSAVGVATFQLRVQNRLPSARIAEPAANFTGLSLSAVHFTATGSSDPETPLANLQYFWIFGDGAVATGLAVDHAFSRAGTFTVILTVSDGDGGASSATLPVVITNQAPHSIPAANLSNSQTLVSIRFDAGASFDPDGTVQSYLWEFGDGSTSSLKSVDHTYTTAPESTGAFTVRLTVFDNLGASNLATLDVTVANRNPSGVIDFGTPVYATLAAFFRSAGSSDPDGIIVSYLWNFGDQTTAAGSEASHSYAAAGRYNATLTVTDNRGGVNTVSKEVIVEPKPNYGTSTPPPPPVTQPGFEAVAGLAALGAAAVLGASSRRRR
jgi:large repetitive protein